jgi:hypothetical protein
MNPDYSIHAAIILLLIAYSVRDVLPLRLIFYSSRGSVAALIWSAGFAAVCFNDGGWSWSVVPSN